MSYQGVDESGVHLVRLHGDDPFSNELLSVHLQDRFLPPDLFVHQRLCEHRLIDFIVAVSSVAHLRKGEDMSPDTLLI